MLKQLKNLITLVLVFIPHFATSQDGNILISSIQDELNSFLIEQLSNRYHGEIIIEPTKLDKRFKLKPCRTPYEYELPSDSHIGSRTTVIVNCSTPQWSIYLPVDIKIYKDAIVTTRPVSRGEIIELADVDIQKVNITTLNHGFFDNINDVVGLSSTQNLRNRTILKPRQLAKPIIVKRGDLVTIIGKGPGFEVRTNGKSLTDGTMGSSIQVRNTTSKRVIEGIVKGHGTVEVSMK